MPSKPSRVRYSGIAPYIDDTQANRVQALGSSSRLTTEDMKELGTLNIVEIVDDVPQVDISVDQNENGTNDLIALFANHAYGCQVVAVPNGAAIGSNQVKVLPGSYYFNGERVLFEGATLTSPTTGPQKVYLKGEIAGGGSAKVGITGGSVPAGTIQIGSFTGSTSITQSSITDDRPFKNITIADFELANVDIFVPVKQSGSGDVVKRTMYMEKAYLNNADFTFQTSGVATASFRLETDNKRWFLNDNAQIIVNQFKATASQTTYTLTNTPAVLANGNKLLKVTRNGNVLVEGTDYSVSGTTMSLIGQAVAAGDLVKVRYTSTTGGSFFAPVPATEQSHPEIAGGLKQGNIEIYLSDNTTQRVTRVQSARVSMPLTRDQLMELGAMKPYDRPLQLPANVTVSLEFRDSDLEMMARFAGFDPNTVDEIALEDLLKSMTLTVKLFRETDVKRAKLPAGHPNRIAIKTFTVQNLIPQSENWDVRVDSDATQSFEFLAHNLTISDSISPN